MANPSVTGQGVSTPFNATSTSQSTRFDLMSAMDISDGIDKTRAAILGIRTPISLMATSAAYLIAGIVCFWLTWLFDYDSTLDYLVPGVTAVFTLIGTPSWWSLVGSSLLFFLSLTNTMVELFTPILAKQGIHIARWLIIATLVFDAHTDMPRVVVFLSAYEPVDSVLSWYIWVLAHPILLFFASFGLEYMAMILMFGAMMAIVQSLLAVGKQTSGRFA